MSKRYYYIYKTTNLVNSKIYVGVHSSKKPNDSYIGSGMLLHRAIKKYGKENFKKEILEYFDSSEEAFLKEAELIDENFIKREDTYNLGLGGLGGIGYRSKGKPPWNKGKKMAPEIGQKMSKTRTGQPGHALGKKWAKEPKPKIKKDRKPIWNKGKKLGPSNQKGKKLYTNGYVNKLYFPDDPNIPSEFYLGDYTKPKGKKCYTNGKINKYFMPGDINIPEDFYLGNWSKTVYIS